MRKGCDCIRFLKKSVKRVIKAWLSLFLVIILVLGCIGYRIQPIIIRYAESIAETEMLNSANKAVLNVITKEKIDYDKLAVLTKDKNGKIISLEIDTYKINFFKSSISNEISDIISKRERFDVAIPIGTFFSNTYTVGYGPDIKFKMQITTTAVVDFDNEFKSVGINQVLHKIVIDIKINGSLVIAGYKKGISVNTSAIAAQTVIVGEIPKNFTNVIENENDNTAGLINDYGAMGD